MLLMNINPATGDNNAIVLWVVVGLLVVSVLAILALGISFKRKKNKRR